MGFVGCAVGREFDSDGKKKNDTGHDNKANDTGHDNKANDTGHDNKANCNKYDSSSSKSRVSLPV